MMGTPGSTRGRPTSPMRSNGGLDDVSVISNGNSSPSYAVVNKARGLLDQLRDKARTGTGPERAACEALARECETKLNSLEARLSRENSPVRTPRSGSPGRRSPQQSPRSPLASSVKRRLDVELDGLGSVWAWSRMAAQSFVQEVSPYLLICITTALVSRSHAPDTKPILAVAAYSAVGHTKKVAAKST
jgi:hypothetical protein